MQKALFLLTEATNFLADETTLAAFGEGEAGVATLWLKTMNIMETSWICLKQFQIFSCYDPSDALLIRCQMWRLQSRNIRHAKFIVQNILDSLTGYPNSMNYLIL